MQQRDKIKPILFSIIKHSSPEELKRQIPRDIVAGIVVAIVALPLSIALGIASGVSPEQGLYTAIVAGFLIAFLGGSRVQISGPTAAFTTIAWVALVSAAEPVSTAANLPSMLKITTAARAYITKCFIFWFFPPLYCKRTFYYSLYDTTRAREIQ